jgi:hypothetical protein
MGWRGIPKGKGKLVGDRPCVGYHTGARKFDVPHRRILPCRVGKNKNPKSPSKLLGQNEVKLMESCFAPTNFNYSLDVCDSEQSTVNKYFSIIRECVIAVNNFLSAPRLGIKSL